jgi:hypothetical protein
VILEVASARSQQTSSTKVVVSSMGRTSRGGRAGRRVPLHELCNTYIHANLLSRNNPRQICHDLNGYFPSPSPPLELAESKNSHIAMPAPSLDLPLLLNFPTLLCPLLPHHPLRFLRFFIASRCPFKSGLLCGNCCMPLSLEEDMRI